MFENVSVVHEEFCCRAADEYLTLLTAFPVVVAVLAIHHASQKRNYMKKVEQAEELADLHYMFEQEGFGPVTVPLAAAATIDNSIETAALDAFVAGLKWTFLYVPGAVTIHMIVMIIVLLLPYTDPFDMVPQTIGTALVATFLIMFGIGKLKQLKYLRVVGTIFATACVLSVVDTIVGIFLPGGFVTLFLWTMPITVCAGILAKRHTDRLQK
jgi:hypothetical protein